MHEEVNGDIKNVDNHAAKIQSHDATKDDKNVYKFVHSVPAL